MAAHARIHAERATRQHRRQPVRSLRAPTSVQSFTVDKSISFLLIPVLGGVRSLWGVVLGAFRHRPAGGAEPDRRHPSDPVRARAGRDRCCCRRGSSACWRQRAAGSGCRGEAHDAGARHPSPRRRRTSVWRSFTVLRSVTLSVPEQGLIGLIGPNGSGKTTLFNIVGGYLPLQSGVIEFAAGRSPHSRCRIATGREW